MNKKIIFLDVDGTLTYEEEKVSKRVVEAIQQARKNGHYVFLCTGRNKIGASFLDEIGFDGIIASAGSYIEVNGQMIDESYLTYEEVQEVQQAMDECGVLYNMEATNCTFADDEIIGLYIQGFLKMDHMNSEMQRLIHEHKQQLHVKSLQDYANHPELVHKISFIAINRESLQQLEEKLSSQYLFVIHDLYSLNTINGELIKYGVDKGKAVLKVVEHLGQSIEDTICFGDSRNDYEMLETCYYGVAMGNAVDELKEIATTVCETVQEDGIYHEFKRLGII